MAQHSIVPIRHERIVPDSRRSLRPNDPGAAGASLLQGPLPLAQLARLRLQRYLAPRLDRRDVRADGPLRARRGRGRGVCHRADGLRGAVDRHGRRAAGLLLRALLRHDQLLLRVAGQPGCLVFRARRAAPAQRGDSCGCGARVLNPLPAHELRQRELGRRRGLLRLHGAGGDNFARCAGPTSASSCATGWCCTA